MTQQRKRVVSFDLTEPWLKSPELRVRTKQAVLKLPVISIPLSFRQCKASVSCCKSQCILHSPHQVCAWKFDGYRGFARVTWLVTDCCLHTPLVGPSLNGGSGAMTHDAEKPNLILIGQHSESDFRSITDLSVCVKFYLGDWTTPVHSRN